VADELGGRYFREARFFLAGDRVVATSHVHEARMLMGYMRDQLALGGPPIQVQYATLSDGTTIRATMMNGQYQAQIVSIPVPKPELGGSAYEIWVRPSWGAEYDWVVVTDEGCNPYTERRDPILYSNRLWQAPDQSIYCVIGGHDQDKYFGTAGDTVAKDGVSVGYYGAGVVGVAEFLGRLVVVTVANVTNSASPARDQQIYTVYVDGVEQLVTSTIDAYVDGGYSTYIDPVFPSYGVKRHFSQTTVVFNADGSEGASVLGNASVIKFSLIDTLGVTDVTYVIEAIPSAQATYHEYTYIQTDSEITCKDDYVPLTPLHMTLVYDETRVYSYGKSYEVALSCDYALVAGIETLVYCMMHDAGDEYGYTTSKIGTYDAYGASLTDTALALTVYDPLSENRLYYSTGETIYSWFSNAARNLSETSFFSAWEDLSVPESVVLLGLDIKNSFALLHSSKSGVKSIGQVTFEYTFPSLTINQSAEYSEETFPAGWGKFIGVLNGVTDALEVQYGPADSLVNITVPSAYHDTFYIPGCPIGVYPVSEHSLSVLSDDATARTDTRARYPLLETDITYYDTRLFDCFSMVVPDKYSVWNRALVFLRVPTYPEDYTTSATKAYAVCMDQAVEITEQFVELNEDGITIDHPTDSEPIARHSGIIRKRT